MIDFEKLTGKGRVHNLSGHDKGQAAREYFGLDELDNSTEAVIVVIPKDVYALSSSFVQGMFAKSYRRLGTIDAFFAHYRFSADSNIIRQIERGLATDRPRMRMSLMQKHA